MDSPNKLDAMDVNSLIKVNAQVFNLVHYVGLSPLKWNPVTEKIYQVGSKWYRIVWLTLLSVFTILETVIVLNFIMKKSYYTPFDLTRVTDGMHLIMTFVYMITTILHWHTVFWRDELIQLTNGLHLYFKTYSESTFIHPPKMHKNFAAIFTRSQVMNLVGLCFGTTIMYIRDCKMHFLVELFPVCQPNGSMSHYSIPWVIAMSAVQFAMTVYMASSILIVTALGSAIDVFGLQVWTEIMKIKDLEFYKNRPIKKFKWWLKNYNCWVLLVHFGNYTLCLLPYIYAFYMGVQIILLYAFIMTQEGVENKVTNVVFQLVVLGCYFVTPFCASLFFEKVNQVVESEKRNCRSKYQMKLYKSLLPIRTNIGNFGYITKLTLVRMLETVVSNTINLIIMAKT